MGRTNHHSRLQLNSCQVSNASRPGMVKSFNHPACWWLAARTASYSSESPIIRRGHPGGDRLSPRHDSMSTAHMRLWYDGWCQRFTQSGVRVHHVTYITRSLMTLFGGWLRKHRFQPAKSRLDCLEVMVKTRWSNAGSLVARKAFSVGRNCPGHIRRIPHPGDCNLRRHHRWKGFGQQKVKYNDLATTCIFVPSLWKRGGAWCSQSVQFVEDLGRRITAVTNELLQTTYLYQRLCVLLQRGSAVAFNNIFPETVIFSTTVANLVR